MTTSINIHNITKIENTESVFSHFRTLTVTATTADGAEFQFIMFVTDDTTFPTLVKVENHIIEQVV